MNTLQPGDGYTFRDSSSGVSIDITKPWTPATDGGTGLMTGISLPKFPNPPQPPSGLLVPTPVKPLQFQCNTFVAPLSGVPTPMIQIAMGSVTYTQSLMPYIKTGAFSDYRQAFINFAAVVSEGVIPVPIVSPGSPYMLGGGGYALTGQGRWYVTLTKWDVSAPTELGGLIDLEMPWVSIVKDDSPEFSKLFVDQGPSLYMNTTNIQKMDGYDNLEGGDLDWGHCHTTYFNPKFFGNQTRVLAVIDSVPAVPCTATITVLREGGPAIGNEVQTLTITGQYNAGTVSFTYGPTQTTSQFNPSTQTAYDLQACLNTIPLLMGNVYVQQVATGVYQIEFTNTLRNTNVQTLGVVSSLTSFTNWYNVTQMHVGSQTMEIPCELNATFLMNKEGVTEAEDPYYLNEAATPPWSHVVNLTDATAAAALAFTPGFATPIVNDLVPRAITTVPLNYAEEGGCTPGENVCKHPFYVHKVGEVEGVAKWKVCDGMVNNISPASIETTEFDLNDGYIYLQIDYDAVGKNFPSPGGVYVFSSLTLPTATTAYGIVALAQITGGAVTQLVTGSLWGDRIQVGSGGTENAHYYYARV